jgi:hypothetical protein
MRAISCLRGISPIARPQSDPRRSYSQDTQVLVDSPVDRIDSRVDELVKENGVLQKV